MLFSPQLDPPPAYLHHRMEMFSHLKTEYDTWVSEQEPKPIRVTLPDGKVVEGSAWKTTPYEVARGIR